MLQTTVRILKSWGVDTRAIYQRLSAGSLNAALKEQNLSDDIARLRDIVPNIGDQYSESFNNLEFERYWEIKMRALHAFQVQCILDALTRIGRNGLTVTDIGDSSGTHLNYIKALSPDGKIGRSISINSDPGSVDKINAKGGDAVLMRAEDWDGDIIETDLILILETLEHLTDPLRFLHTLATKSDCEFVFFSVPYRRVSRFGGALLREAVVDSNRLLHPETTHMYEFSAADWLLLSRLAGYEPVYNRVYLQYPRRSLFRLMAPIWRKLDHEGFLGVLLRRNLELADRYKGW